MDIFEKVLRCTTAEIHRKGKKIPVVVNRYAMSYGRILLDAIINGKKVAVILFNMDEFCGDVFDTKEHLTMGLCYYDNFIIGTVSKKFKINNKKPFHIKTINTLICMDDKKVIYNNINLVCTVFEAC